MKKQMMISQDCCLLQDLRLIGKPIIIFAGGSPLFCQ